MRDNYVRQSTHYLIVKHAQTSLFKYAEKVEGDFSLSNSSCFSKKMFGLNQDRKCFIAILFVPIALNFYRIFNFPRSDRDIFSSHSVHSYTIFSPHKRALI